MTTPAWQIYYDAFHRRAARIPEQRFGRDEAFARAAHEAYRTTANHLTRDQAWDDDRVLVLTHAFGKTVQDWIARGTCDWSVLRDELEARSREFDR
jgi:hypothetical protein